MYATHAQLTLVRPALPADIFPQNGHLAGQVQQVDSHIFKLERIAYQFRRTLQQRV